MYLVYKPEGSDEPQRFRYEPRRNIMSAEREMLERRTDRNYSEFTKDVVAGSSVCRRALLFLFQKRDHPGVKYEDVDFAWDELTLEYSKGELLAMREEVVAKAPPDQLAAVLEKLDEQISEAFEDPEEKGKALLPLAE